MKSEAFLSEIRSIEALRRAVLKKIVIEGRKIIFFLVTDLTYRRSDVDAAAALSQKYVPEGYIAEVSVVKSVPSEEGVRATVLELLHDKFPAAAAFVTPGDIEVTLNGTGGRFLLSVSESERARFAAADVLNVLSDELSRRFCGGWLGDFRRIERAPQKIEHGGPPPAEVVLAPRFFPVEGFEAIDGAEVENALCIADLKGEMPLVTLCGELVHLDERTTKTGKPYFRLTVRDSSGVLTLSYFAKKATVEKVRSLAAGTSICLTGVNELFNGSFRFTANKIDLGRPPEGYVAQKNYLPVPAAYTVVHPEPCSDLVQADLFGGKPLPENFRQGKYVVFDLETTGLNHTPAGGNMDRIIEIGAVKIADGAITEKFSTFVACPVRLSAEIKELTGITDDMLIGAPEAEKALADFYKFCDGSDLVAHNVAFDSAFVRHYGEEAGYLFNHRLFDTVALAQEILRLGNYKLNTIADHYGFTFNHHRAFDDAFVTAKIFIELVREKGEVPKPFSTF